MTSPPPMSRLKLTTVIPYAILLAEVLVFYRHVLFYDGFVNPLGPHGPDGLPCCLLGREGQSGEVT